jgi:hypothetical protein
MESKLAFFFVILFPVDWFQFAIFTGSIQRKWQQKRVQERTPESLQG